ncbi:hypothetical protein NKG05_01840 [Oerskovia sp. M15]
MTSRAIADVAALLAAVTLDQCRQVAQLALAAESAADARAVVRAALPSSTSWACEESGSGERHVARTLFRPARMG